MGRTVKMYEVASTGLAKGLSIESINYVSTYSNLSRLASIISSLLKDANGLE